MQFLEPFVQVGLTLGQLAEPVQDLAGLALLAFTLRLLLLGSRGPLLLVTVLVVLQLELLELPLRGLPRRTTALAALPGAPGDLELAGPELEQGLVSGLLGDQGRRERLDRRRVRFDPEMLLRLLHLNDGLVQARLR